MVDYICPKCGARVSDPLPGTPARCSNCGYPGTISPKADVHPDAKIGKHVSIRGHVYIEGNVEIGEGSLIRGFAVLVNGVRIGKNCFIGNGVTFTNDIEPTSDGQQPWKEYKTIVLDNVSIGSNATICPGVTIGEGALVGAGAVVTKDVAPYTVVVGNPARVLKVRS